ncbi:MAG: NCS2 family permease [Anaerovoracaceae bacterium]|jgi:AGZA family xanthine/uracil permease-like MFS transporter
MEKIFNLSEAGTSPRNEVVGGVTTFLSMVYILAVNPSILSAAGMNASAVFTATTVSAAFATLLMAFLANYPVALASGMGLNAYFAYTVCGDLAKAGVQDPWQVALAAVLVEGICFILLTLCKFREALVNDLPRNLKLGITSGIGLFIAFIGMENAGIVVDSESTLVTLGDLGSAPVALALIGLLVVIILWHFKVPGYILWGILVTWALGMIAQVGGWYHVDPAAGSYSVFPDLSGGIHIAAPPAFQFAFSYAAHHLVDFIVVVFSFIFVDLFDTAGTLIGICNKANLLDENGNMPRAGRALMSDAVGTVFGACMGTSTVTSYAESFTGVAAGARTGLASVVTGLLFLAALPLAPVFTAIPSFATAPALMFVGLAMLDNVRDMDFTEDAAAAVSGFLAMVMMPFTDSIANGIMFGMLSFAIVRIFQGRARDVHAVVWISAAIFVVRIITLVV